MTGIYFLASPLRINHTATVSLFPVPPLSPLPPRGKASSQERAKQGNYDGSDGNSRTSLLYYFTYYFILKIDIKSKKCLECLFLLSFADVPLVTFDPADLEPYDEDDWPVFDAADLEPFDQGGDGNLRAESSPTVCSAKKICAQVLGKGGSPIRDFPTWGARSASKPFKIDANDEVEARARGARGAWDLERGDL